MWDFCILTTANQISRNPTELLHTAPQTTAQQIGKRASSDIRSVPKFYLRCVEILQETRLPKNIRTEGGIFDPTAGKHHAPDPLSAHWVCVSVGLWSRIYSTIRPLGSRTIVCEKSSALLQCYVIPPPLSPCIQCWTSAA